jgi:dephospho-CoA kinase
MSDSSPFRVVLTGGIASGKSAVATEFSKLGVPIIDTDDLAREVVEPGQPALAAIVERFGSEVLDARGGLDRRRMRERIFQNPADRQALEAIVHPAIRAAQQAKMLMVSGPYQIHVVPLLLDTHSQSLYDRVLVVDCPRETQLARLLRRDGITQQLAERMLAAQATREQRLAIADDVLTNDGTIDELPQKTAALHQLYLQLAAARRHTS